MARDRAGGKSKQLRLGEDKAACVDALYREHSGWLGRILSSRFRATAIEVDDLVQDTYVRIARYEPEDAARNPKALLMRIAVNLARDHMRKNVVRGGLCAIEDNEIDSFATPPEQDHLLQLKQIVLSLPPIYRDVFVLNRFTGLTYQEIASHVGISVKAVEWRMSKALSIIMTRMQD